MRVTKEKAAANRARVVREAARLFKDRGVDRVGVADLMQAAGLTHGGFYNHFPSKEALTAEAVGYSFERAIARLEKRIAEAGPQGRAQELRAYIGRYLSSENRDAPGPACPMAALGTDAARQGPAVREAFAAGTERYIEKFAALLAGGRGETVAPAASRAEAMLILSSLVGALTLARAVDPALSDEILRTVEKHLSERAADHARGSASASAS